MTTENSGGRSRVLSVISHILFIVIIFILPELVMTFAMPHRANFGLVPGFYVKSILYISVFYLNYLVLVDHYLLDRTGRSIARFVCFNLLTIVIVLVLGWFISRLLPPPDRPPHPRMVLKMTSNYLRDSVMLILTVGLAVALRLSSKWKELHRQQQELIAIQRATELESLKQQINPHFLFNTLNNIYALIPVDSTAAQDAVHRLSAMMRYMLYEDVSYVRLEQEADFIRNYVSLMSIRLSDCKVELNIDIAEHSEDMIVPLVFITPVENAFKHLSREAGSPPLTISLQVEGDNVVLMTSNNYDPAQNTNSGRGLQILRRRLTLLYGSRATFATTADGNSFKTRLSIPLTK